MVYNNNIPDFEVSFLAFPFFLFSFFQQDQNSLGLCLINCQCFLQYMSGMENSPCCGETIFDFMVRMFTGNESCRLVGSLRTSMVRGLEFKVPSTSVIIVSKDLSSKHSPCVFKSDPRMALAE